MTGECATVAGSDAVAVDIHRGSVSCTRAPLKMPSTLRALPSWQAYSYTGPLVRVNGTAAVHGRVQMVGSSMMNRYSIAFAATRVNRSIGWRFSSDPLTL